MAVGAHAFDAEVMAAGALALNVRAGGTASLVHLTLGEMGHPVLAPDAYRGQKVVEAKEAARTVGAEAFFGPAFDGALEADSATVAWLESLIVARRPSYIVAHWTGSVHEDHHSAGRITEKAVFRAGLPWRRGGSHVVSGIYYGENWEDPIGFERHVFVDVSPVHDVWLAALQAYALFRDRADLSTFRYEQYYVHLRRMVGALVGVDEAEAFMLPAAGLRRLRPGLADPDYRLVSMGGIIGRDAPR